MSHCDTCHGVGGYESRVSLRNGLSAPGPVVACPECPRCEWCGGAAPSHEYTPAGELLCLECWAEPDEPAPTFCGDCGDRITPGQIVCRPCGAEGASVRQPRNLSNAGPF